LPNGRHSDTYDDFDEYIEDLEDRNELEEFYEQATPAQQRHIEEVRSEEELEEAGVIPEESETDQVVPTQEGESRREAIRRFVRGYVEAIRRLVRGEDSTNE
jgi:hypothetical protein